MYAGICSEGIGGTQSPPPWEGHEVILDQFTNRTAAVMLSALETEANLYMLSMTTCVAGGGRGRAFQLWSFFRSDAFRRLKYWVLGGRFFRRLATQNYGCGRVALGERNSYNFPICWITVDWTEADFQLWLGSDTYLPFADASQDVMYAAHMLEHVEEEALAHLLKEVARVLKPGGAIRIEVPDTDKLVAAYRANDRDLLDMFRASREQLVHELPHLGEKYLEDHVTVLGEIANYIDRDVHEGHIPVYAPKAEFERHLSEGLAPLNAWAQSLKTPAQRRSGGHSNALNFDRLSQALYDAGFREVRRTTLGRTSIPRLRLGRGWRRIFDCVPEVPARSTYSLYVEAIV